jgi:aldose 1-epimerase
MMKALRLFLLVVLACGFAVRADAQRYTAVRDGDIVRLTDRSTDTIVSVMPSVGNIAFEMLVKGHNVLRFPHASLDDFRARPNATGIPFMGPWANRLDEQAFYANGRRYAFDMSLGNVRGAIPIHGFLTTTNQWQVTTLRSTDDAAWVTSRLEFSRQPAWMKQWPFAHTIDMTYRLADGMLEVTTEITNTGTDPMPVAVGFHPYFQLTDSPRDEWTIAVGARTRWTLDTNKVPTGDTVPIEQLFPNPSSAPLRDYSLDDVFSDLVRNEAGGATMSVWGRRQRLDVVIGEGYRSVVVWAPSPSGAGRGGQGPSPPGERNFICFEPMAGITNAVNMAHRGTYRELQTIAPGGTWRARFSIQPSGFERAQKGNAR